MGRAVAVRRWTTTALECYKRGCNCEGCFYRDFFSASSQKCQMKASVLELVRVIGAPDVELPQFLADESKIPFKFSSKCVILTKQYFNWRFLDVHSCKRQKH